MQVGEENVNDSLRTVTAFHQVRFLGKALTFLGNDMPDRELRNDAAARNDIRIRRLAAQSSQFPESSRDASAQKENEWKYRRQRSAGIHYCVEHLEAFCSEAGDFKLSQFSDFWASDYSKTARKSDKRKQPFATFYDEG
jgi:hypothetical protein